MRSCKVCGVSLEGKPTFKSYPKICKPCYTQKQKDRWAGQTDQYRLFISAKARAKEKGLPFDLEEPDIVVPKVCPVFGVPLERAINGRAWDNSPTLDRFIPSKGYVKGNVQVISWKANRLKSDATIEDLEAIVRWMKRSE